MCVPPTPEGALRAGECARQRVRRILDVPPAREADRWRLAVSPNPFRGECL